MTSSPRPPATGPAARSPDHRQRDEQQRNQRQHDQQLLDQRQHDQRLLDQRLLDQRLDAIARLPFRARFHLRGRDRATAELRGPSTIRWHAHDLIAGRLAPAEPYKDGKQTPYRGHPVLVAQHATGTCCRTCLQRLHGIPKGRALSREERAYVVAVVCRWIEREVAGGEPPTRHG